MTPQFSRYLLLAVLAVLFIFFAADSFAYPAYLSGYYYDTGNYNTPVLASPYSSRGRDISVSYDNGNWSIAYSQYKYENNYPSYCGSSCYGYSNYGYGNGGYYPYYSDGIYTQYPYYGYLYGFYGGNYGYGSAIYDGYSPYSQPYPNQYAKPPSISVEKRASFDSYSGCAPTDPCAKVKAKEKAMQPEINHIQIGYDRTPQVTESTSFTQTIQSKVNVQSQVNVNVATQIIVPVQEEHVEEEETLEVIPPVQNPQCSSVKLIPSSVYLSSYGKTEGHMILRNNAFMDFYIDNVIFYDFSDNVSSYNTGFTHYIPAGSTGKLHYRFVAATTRLFAEKGYVKVYGHFANTKSCGDAIQTSFDIFFEGNGSAITPPVINPPVTNPPGNGNPGNDTGNLSCDAFKVNAPAKVSVENNAVPVTFTNPFNKDVRVNVIGNGVKTTPVWITVPANSFVEKTIVFDVLPNPNRIKLNPIIPGCQTRMTIIFIEEENEKGASFAAVPTSLEFNAGNTVTVTLMNENSHPVSATLSLENLPQGFTATPVAFTLPSQTSENVTLVLSGEAPSASNFTASVVLTSQGKKTTKSLPVVFTTGNVLLKSSTGKNFNNSYDITITIENNESTPLVGMLALDVPASWNVTGNPEVVLASSQSKTVTFTVTPAEALTTLTLVPIQFQFGNRSKTTLASLNALGNNTPTGFVTFSNTVSYLGLLILVFAIALLVSLNRPKTLGTTKTRATQFGDTTLQSLYVNPEKQPRRFAFKTAEESTA